MSSVDNRIVSMRFDNSNFQKGVRDTVSSLEKLREALRLSGAKKGFEEVENTSKKISLDNLIEAVKTLNNRFTSLGIVAITTLSNIVNKAVDAGLSIAKSLSIDPILDGYREYETKLGSIQTILANTAKHNTTTKEINESLDELNKYADETIYNFGDMTRNIGYFTNSGLKVQEATSMIKGFSNEAAASGTDSMRAAGAAYQLSQALSTGVVRLMDWRSLTNAGMGGANMRSGLIDIANAMGTLSEKGLSAETIQKDFNGSLEKGWLTAGVMSKYLQIMAGDMDSTAMASLGLSDAQIKMFLQQQKTAQEAATKVRTFSQLMGTLKESVGSGWAKTFEILVGDFDEATNLLTPISNVLTKFFDNISDQRNNILKTWSDLGGRKTLIEGLGTALKDLGKILALVKDAFSEVFPEVTGETLKNLTDSFVSFLNTIKPTEKQLENVKTIFKGLFSVISIILKVIGLVGTAFIKMISGLNPLINPLLELLATISNIFISIDSGAKNSGLLVSVFTTVKKVVENLATALGSVVTGLNNILTSGSIEGLGKGVKSLVNWFKELIGSIKNFLSEVYGKYFSGIGEYFSRIGNSLSEGLGSMDFTNLLNVLNTGFLGGIFLLVKNLVNSLKDLGPGGFLDSLKGTLEGVTDTLDGMSKKLKADALKSIALAIGILAVSLFVLSAIPADRIATGLGGLAGAVTILTSSMYAMVRIFTPADVLKLNGLGVAMTGLSLALILLSTALVKMGSIPFKDILNGLAGLIGSLTAIALFMNVVSKTSLSVKTAAAIFILSLSLTKIADSVSVFSKLDITSMTRGLLGLSASLGAIALFTKVMNSSGFGVFDATGIFVLSFAIKNIAEAVIDISSLNTDSLFNSVITLSSLLGALAIFTKVTNSSLSTATTVLAISIALKVLTDSLLSVSSLSWDQLAVGLTGISGGLLALGLSSQLISGNLLGMIGAGAMLNLLALAIKNISSLGIESVITGLIGLGGALGLLTAALVLLGNVPVASVIKLGLMVVPLVGISIAITLVANALRTLSEIPTDGLVKSIVALAAIFAVLGVAGYLLMPVTPAIWSIAGAMLAFSTALLGFGIAVSALVGAIGILVSAGVGGIDIVVSAILSIVAILPAVAVGLAAAVAAFVGAIAEKAPEVATAVSIIIAEILRALTEAVPPLIDLVVTIISEVIDALIELVPKLMDLINVIISEVLDLIVEKVPEFVNSAMELVTALLTGISERLPELYSAAADVIIEFLNGIGNELPRVWQAGIDLIINLLNGIADSIRNNHKRIEDAGLNIGSAILEAMGSALGRVFGVIGNFINNTVGSISKEASRLWNSAKRAGQDIINGLVQGLREFGGRVTSTLENIGKDAWNNFKNFFGIASPAKKMIWAGKQVVDGLIVGLGRRSDKAIGMFRQIGEDMYSELQSTLSNPNILPDTINSNPVISPVLDLSDLHRKSNSISKLLTSKYSVGVSTHISRLDNFSDDQMSTRVGHGDTNVTFIQNNHSPKSLSREEIYRQTKAQINQLRKI